MLNKRENFSIITDCDEVLTCISPLWVQYIHDNKDYFRKYFNLINKYDYKKDNHYNFVLKRIYFNLEKWMMKDNLNLKDEEKQELFIKFFNLYNDIPFYDKCFPTKMAEGLYKMSGLDNLKSIYIVTRISDGKNNLDSKRRFLKGILPKAEIVTVKSKEKKSSVINQIIQKENNISMIIEDELKNIHDILDNCNAKNPLDIYIPLYGYNKPTNDLYAKSDKKKMALVYY